MRGALAAFLPHFLATPPALRVVLRGEHLGSLKQRPWGSGSERSSWVSAPEGTSATAQYLRLQCQLLRSQKSSFPWPHPLLVSMELGLAGIEVPLKT